MRRFTQAGDEVTTSNIDKHDHLLDPLRFRLGGMRSFEKLPTKIIEIWDAANLAVDRGDRRTARRLVGEGMKLLDAHFEAKKSKNKAVAKTRREPRLPIWVAPVVILLVIVGGVQVLNKTTHVIDRLHAAVDSQYRIDHLFAQEVAIGDMKVGQVGYTRETSVYKDGRGKVWLAGEFSSVIPETYGIFNTKVERRADGYYVWPQGPLYPEEGNGGPDSALDIPVKQINPGRG